jgi:hypothetical protein
MTRIPLEAIGPKDGFLIVRDIRNDREIEISRYNRNFLTVAVPTVTLSHDIH